MKMTLQSRWPNVIRGVAYGDSWGGPTEFTNIAALTANNPMGPSLPSQLDITDDTQMTLSLARALSHATVDDDKALRDRVIDEFILWYDDPDNNRSPGACCVSSIRGLDHGKPWPQATDRANDGCGTVMRVSPAAFLANGRWQAMAAYQAALTHGGWIGIAASVVQAAIVRHAAAGNIDPGETSLVAYHIAKGTKGFDHITDGCAKWLQPLIVKDGDPDPEDPWQWAYTGKSIRPRPAVPHSVVELWEALHQGFLDLANVLANSANMVAEFQAHPWAEDPCKYGGQGWRAQHALATALLAADTFPNDPKLALRRAVTTNGDSDSIAAVAGAVIGALHENPWPKEWFHRLEPRYQRWIALADGYAFS